MTLQIKRWTPKLTCATLKINVQCNYTGQESKLLKTKLIY